LPRGLVIRVQSRRGLPHVPIPAGGAAGGVGEAARVLGMDPSAVRRAILQGRLPATKFGRDWSIRATDVAAYKQRPHRGGRPRRTLVAMRDD